MRQATSFTVTCFGRLNWNVRSIQPSSDAQCITCGVGKSSTLTVTALGPRCIVAKRPVPGSYATAGVPAFFSPYTLLGLEVGGGLIARASAMVSLVLELRADFFFVGNDLPENSMLSKFDVALGVRLPL